MSIEPLSGGVPGTQVGDESEFCPRDHGCSLPAGHDGHCELTAAVCECAECEARHSGPVEPVADTEAVETDGGLVQFTPHAASEHEHDGTCGRDHDSGWTCTRVRGHDGNHEAGGGGGFIYASWPNVVSSSTREDGETDERLICPQCGQPYVDRACGPTHAVIGDQVSRAPDLERELANARRELRDARAEVEQERTKAGRAQTEIERLKNNGNELRRRYINKMAERGERIKQLVAGLAAERAKVQRVREALTNCSAVRAEYVLKLLAGGEDR